MATITAVGGGFSLNACVRAARALAIDLDGTLVDTLPDFHAAITAMLLQMGLPTLTIDQVERLVGKGSEHLVRGALAVALSDARQADRLFDQALATYFRHYEPINGCHSRVYPGVVPALQALQAAGHAMVCLTNKPQAYAQALLQAKGLARFFVHTFGGDRFARKKPDPMPLRETCAILGVAPHELLMVGDSGNDAQAARAAGCPVVLVSYGYNHGEPVQGLDVDAVIDSLLELVA